MTILQMANTESYRTATSLALCVGLLLVQSTLAALGGKTVQSKETKLEKDLQCVVREQLKDLKLFGLQ